MFLKDFFLKVFENTGILCLCISKDKFSKMKEKTLRGYSDEMGEKY